MPVPSMMAVRKVCCFRLISECWRSWTFAAKIPLKGERFDWSSMGATSLSADDHPHERYPLNHEPISSAPVLINNCETLTTLPVSASLTLRDRRRQQRVPDLTV